MKEMADLISKKRQKPRKIEVRKHIRVSKVIEYCFFVWSSSHEVRVLQTPTCIII